MHRKTRFTWLAAAAAGALLLSNCSSLSSSGNELSSGAEFPGSQPVTVLMPYTAGGSSDLLVRALEPFLAEALGTKVVVENQVGAGGQVALTALAGAAADGHTIGLTNLPSSLAYINPDKQATYDRESFQPLGSINRFRGIAAVSSDSEWATLEDLVTAAQATPGSVTVGVDGLTGDDHIAALEFQQATGTELKVVPFDSGSEKLTALIGGQIDLSLGTVPTFDAQLDTGEIKALAALDAERIPGLDDVPTASEQGYDLLWASYNVLSAPAGLPADVQQTWEDAIKEASEAAMADDAFVQQMEAGGYVFGRQDAAWADETWVDLENKWEELVPLARNEQS
jgi:tripartite-type tricarboxylate transporter receptor subunit TctC